MDLSQATKGAKVKVVRIHAQIPLKKRLASLGLSVGKEIKVLETTLQKNTIEIAMGATFLALRLDEAKQIEIEVKNA